MSDYQPRSFIFGKIYHIGNPQHESQQMRQIRDITGIPPTNLIIMKFVAMSVVNADLIHQFFVGRDLVAREFQRQVLFELLDIINNNINQTDALMSMRNQLEAVCNLNNEVELFEYNYV